MNVHKYLCNVRMGNTDTPLAATHGLNFDCLECVFERIC